MLAHKGTNAALHDEYLKLLAKKSFTILDIPSILSSSNANSDFRSKLDALRQTMFRNPNKNE